MISSGQRGAEATRREEFQHSLQLLDGITVWHLWSSALVILLLPGLIALLSFPSQFAQLSLFQKSEASLFVRELLCALLVVSVFSLYHLRRLLQRLRRGLIEQTDAATRYRVRGEQFYGLSIRDPLTGLFNRRFGETRLKEEITRTQKSDDPLLLLALDFDRFKEINDNYGHTAGDLALKEFSRRLQRAIRACDVPIRTGGDEFLVILPECSPDKIKMILSRMGSVVLNLDGDQIPVSFSCGMTQYQGDDTPETMIKRADERLYAAKAKRRTGDATDRTAGKKPVAASKNSESPSQGASVSPREFGTRPGLFRRGPRIQKQIAIILTGSDLEGRAFSEQTSTVELSRHGSMVVSQRKLAPDQEMIIRRQDTNNEAAARIVRKAGSQSDTYVYGLELLCSNFDIWGIEFARLSESEEETIRMMFECAQCKTRETVDDSDHESDGGAANSAVVRSCSRCGSVTTWTRLLHSDPETSVTGKCVVPVVEVKVPDVR
jgi:diguanylate cyclase (GGDEF)-like protein